MSTDTFLPGYPHHLPRRLPETSRLARLLDMACQIGNAPGYWTRAALAARYAVSERQITKDLDLLRHTLKTPIVRRPHHAGRQGYAFERRPRLDWLAAA